MKTVILSLVAVAGIASHAAQAKELTAGEMYGNAETTDAKAFALRPFGNSSYGVSDQVDVKLPILGLTSGFRPSVEYMPLNNDAMALSVEPALGLSWNSVTTSYGATVRWTDKVGDSRFNANVGGFFVSHDFSNLKTSSNGDPELQAWLEELQAEILHDGFSVPLQLSFDAVASEQTAFSFIARTNMTTLIDGDTIASGGIHWTHGGKKSGRISLGLEALYITLPPLPDVLSFLPNSPSAVILPYPWVGFWWKI